MENISGFICLNKPAGMSSAAAVSKVKRATGMACGHMGTLDPMAEGVLPVAVGNAARLFQYLLEKEKTYRAVFRFGVETDTLDATGTILREGLPVPTAAAIESVLPEFIGSIEQMPPAYSAKSVNGVRAYMLARQGKEVQLKAKTVRINEFSLTGGEGDSFEFIIRCGGGTYVRSLGRDLAAKLDTCASMTKLVREKSGYFTLENSIGLDGLADWHACLIPPDAVFDMPSVDFDGGDAKKLKNGLSLGFPGKDGLYKLYLDDEFYGIAEVKEGRVRAKAKICA